MPRLFGAPAVAANGDGRLELFVFGIDGTLWHIWQTQWSNGWSGWAAFPGGGGNWPAAVTPSGDGRLELFVAGADLGQAWQTAWSNGWSPLVNRGSPPSPVQTGFFAPGIAANADGRLELFVANGSLGRLEQTAWSDDGSWSGWLDHGSPPAGGFVVGPVEAARTADGRIEVFVVDSHGALWNIRQTSAGSGWSGWNSFGSPGSGLDDRPALARNADGRLDLFVRGTDGALWHRWQVAVTAGDNWSDWVSEGTAGVGFLDHPVVATSADARLELFLAGADGNIWHRWQITASNGWSPWTSEGSAGGGFTDAAPAVGRSGDGRLELFAVGRDGNLWHKWQPTANVSNQWSPWTSHGQPEPQPPTTTVPDVREMRATAAGHAVQAAHLVPAFTGQQGPNAWVFSQSPAADATVAQGSTVHMQLHTGPIP